MTKKNSPPKLLDPEGRPITTERMIYTIMLHLQRIADCMERQENRAMSLMQDSQAVMKAAMAAAGIGGTHDSKDDDSGKPD